MGYPLRYGLFMAAYYITNAVYQGYITLYFKHAGMNEAQRGALIAAVSLVSVFAQPFWGTVGDRSKSRARTIRLQCLGAAVLVLLFPLAGSQFGILLAFTCAFSAFYTSIQPMGDSVILESLQERDQPFGPIRWCGCVSFAVASMLFGYLVDGGGREHWILWSTALLLAATCLSTWTLPQTGGAQKSGSKLSMLTLLKNRELMLLIALTMPLQLTMGYFYGFFSTHFTSLPGGSESLLGWCYLISALSETPFLLFSDKLFRKFGAGRLMLASAALLTLRWVLLAATDSVPINMVSQALHGGGFIVITVSTAKYISLTVPAELRSSGQMLLAVTGFGIARVAGNFLGGLAAMRMGEGNVFWFCAALTLLTLLVFAPYYLRKPPLNGETPAPEK